MGMNGILDVHNQKLKEMKSEGMKIQNLWRAALNNEVWIKSTCPRSADMKRSSLECWLMGDEDKTKRRTIAKKCQYEWMARHTSWDNNTVMRRRREMGFRMVCHIRLWGKDYESHLRWWFGNEGENESKYRQATSETASFFINYHSIQVKGFGIVSQIWY